MSSSLSDPTPPVPPPLQSLKLSVEGDIAWIFLDHGKANEMGTAEVADFSSLAEWLEGAPVRSLVISSRRLSAKGTPIFIAGANVSERSDWSTEKLRAHVRFQRETLARLRRVPVWVVAVVAGRALGWGTELLLACDYRIACPGSSFALPETGLGILPGAGGSSELAALVGVHQALRLGMTGEALSDEEAVRIGLCDELAADLDAGLRRARSLGEQVSTRSPTAVAAYKQAVLWSVGQEAAARREIEGRAYEHCVTSGEAAVGRRAFAGKTAPVWGPFRPWLP